MIRSNNVAKYRVSYYDASCQWVAGVEIESPNEEELIREAKEYGNSVLSEYELAGMKYFEIQ